MLEQTTNFFEWYYCGLNPFGGWVIFFILALVAALWLNYDASSKDLKVPGWSMGSWIAVALLLPSMYFRFTQPQLCLSFSMVDLMETFFYMGVLGGIVGPVLAFGYSASNREPAFDPPPPPPPAGPSGGRKATPRVRPVETKEKVAAWLVSTDGRYTHQLNVEITSIGRSAKNDIQVGGDRTVSSQHAKVEERNGKFRYTDRGSSNGSKINGRRVSSPQMLQSGDEIQMGTGQTVFRFTTTN
jgi:hypothetical protein